MKTEYERLDNQITRLERRLKQFPDGKLICAQNGKHFKWYRSDLQGRTYIPKNERGLAEELAMKKYLTFQLDDLKKEKRAIQLYLCHHSDESRAEQLLKKSPEYRNLLSNNFLPLSKELDDWAKVSYPRNPMHQETLTYPSSSGNMLRSKSEVLIDMILYQNRIPFRYECELELNDGIVYPDFTIRHPRTGKVFYWEHFGMMDNPNYCQNAYTKMQRYTESGIIPTIHLITTYETKKYPLKMDVIETLVNQYFLAN